MLEASGVPWTLMRNGMYADELRGWFDAERVNRVPGGDGRMSFTYRPELAEAIAVVLTEPGQEGRVYDITTADAVTMAELAEVAAAVTGEPFSWSPTPDSGWERRWRAAGREDWRIEAGLTSYAALRKGELDVVSDDFRQLAGRAPLTIREIAERVLLLKRAE
jgi:NAD(P)H dehydrogenase (quinone)